MRYNRSIPGYLAVIASVIATRPEAVLCVEKRLGTIDTDPGALGHKTLVSNKYKQSVINPEIIINSKKGKPSSILRKRKYIKIKQKLKRK